MTALGEAKQRLPLSALMHQLGLGEHAKRSAKCPFHDDRANSFSVYQKENGEWSWHCFAGCGGGDEADFIAKLYNISNPSACCRYIDLSGTSGAFTGRTLTSTTNSPVVTKTELAAIPTIPSPVLAAWTEGIDYFFSLKRAKTVKQLAAFRGWPIEFTMFLIESGVISYPLYEDPRTRKVERCLAFQVVVPENVDNRMGKRVVGYHVRVKKAGSASWRFVPSGTPAVPFILGDFDTAQLLVITEGQFDALTFALAAGWLGEGRSWPQGAGVLGLRGVDSVNTFLSYYAPFWPAAASCLVLPDNDEPGKRWHNGDNCLVQRLRKLCRHVAAARCAGAKDFNDLYKLQPIGPPQISDLLARHGMALESEVPA